MELEVPPDPGTQDARSQDLLGLLGQDGGMGGMLRLLEKCQSHPKGEMRGGGSALAEMTDAFLRGRCQPRQQVALILRR